MYNPNNNTGFTLLELITVIALIMVLASLILPTYGNLQSSTSLLDARDQVSQIIKTAKTNACSGKFNLANGIFFDSSAEYPQATLFYGNSYSSRVEELDETVKFGKSVVIADSFTDHELLFSKGTCLPGETGIINISSQTIQNNYSISVNTLGIVNE